MWQSRRVGIFIPWTEWQDMPEAGDTRESLVAYLKLCGFNDVFEEGFRENPNDPAPYVSVGKFQFRWVS